MDLKKSLSDKYATFSIPGSFRKAKTSIFGVKPMQDDPLAAQRRDLDEFESLIATLGHAASSIQTAIEMLAAAPQAMFDPLQRFYPQDVGGYAMVSRFCSQLGEFSVQARQGDQHLQDMQKVLQELSQTNQGIRGAFSQRDLAHQTQAHYSAKVESLQDQIARGGASAKLVEKLNRNMQKKRSGEEAFQQIMADVGSQLNDALTAKWHRLSAAISHLCKFYATVFQSAEQLVRDFNEVGQALVLTTTSEAMMRKGQELAAQAKEKLSSFSNSFQQKVAEGNRAASAAVANATTAWSGGGASSSRPSSVPPQPHQGSPFGPQSYAPGFMTGSGSVQAGDSAAGGPPVAYGGFGGPGGAPPGGWTTWPGAGQQPPLGSQPQPQSWGSVPPGYPGGPMGPGGAPSEPFMGGPGSGSGGYGAPQWGSGAPPGASPSATTRNVKPSMPGQGPWEKMAQAATMSQQGRGRTPWA